MANKPQNELKHADFFLLRTPLLPFDELLSVPLKASEASNGVIHLEQAIAEDRIKLRERLKFIVELPEVREAIFLASPDLDEGLERWLREPESEKGQRIERALTRYYLRMAGRPMPFGLFAGCSVGTMGEKCALTLASRSTYQRHSRLDMDYLYGLIYELEKDSELRNSLVYAPNSSLYEVAGMKRYAETKIKENSRTHFLVAVEPTEYLNLVLEKAKEGATKELLVKTLVAFDPEILVEEAEIYLQELIDTQILVSDLSPTVTGQEPIHQLITKLTDFAPTIANQLKQVQQNLAEIDLQGLGTKPSYYRSIATSLASLPAKIEIQKLYQVDMYKPSAQLVLGAKIIDELRLSVEILHKVAAYSSNVRLDNFRQAFVKRYGEYREIPLVEVLDEEAGIGFNSTNRPEVEALPLLKDLLFPTNENNQPSWQSRHQLLLTKLMAAIAKGEQQINLELSDIDTIAEKDRLPLPKALSVQATIMAKSVEDIDQGDFQIIVESVSGPSGARLLGRFCYGDQQLHTQVIKHLRAEESLAEDIIFAEIVHLPEGRLGNILLRPTLRDYEIPFLGQSGLPTAQQIPITDLTVSLQDNRIVLRSLSLGKEVRPRLTSAHNYNRGSLGIYKFLCSLQEQGVSGGLMWQWGVLESSAFLPRVTVGRLILAPARWLIDKIELERFSKLVGANLFTAVQEWRKERHLPRWLALVDGDNELPIDLCSILHLETFVFLIKNRSQAIIKELLPTPDKLCVTSSEGYFNHEILIPFIQTTKEQVKHSKIDLTFITRNFAPISEWLYIKIFTGTTTADKILREVVSPLVAELQESQTIDQWFFIRYGDPDWHLRLRLHGLSPILITEVLPKLNKITAELLARGFCWKIEFDTYEREIERYGGEEAILIAEKIFHIDSETVLPLLELLAENSASEMRESLAIYGTDRLLKDFGLDITAKYTIIKHVRESFGKQFQADTSNLKHQLGKKYAQDRKLLEQLLSTLPSEDTLLASGIELLNTRSQRLIPLIAQLKNLEKLGKLTYSIDELALSYIHMFLNRLLRSAHRAQELVIYDLLTRFYDSSIARTKRRPTT